MMEITIIVLIILIVLFFVLMIQAIKKHELNKEAKLKRNTYVQPINMAEPMQYNKPIVEPKKAKVYELNQNPIKLNLYKSSSINYSIRDAYENLTIGNYWFNEPFYHHLTTLFIFVSRNEFWVKSKKSKEIVLNMRGADNQIFQSKSFKVLDTIEIIDRSVIKIYEATRPYLKKEKIQLLILNSIIYAIAKSDNFQGDDVDKYDKVIDILFTNISINSKYLLNPINNENFKLIVNIYEESVASAREYPNVTACETDNKKTQLLVNYPKKQLMSIKQ